MCIDDSIERILSDLIELKCISVSSKFSLFRMSQHKVLDIKSEHKYWKKEGEYIYT